MPSPTDGTPGADRRGGRHSAARTPLLRRPAVIAAAAAVVLLAVVVAGASALRQPSVEALASASSGSSTGSSTSSSTGSSSAAPSPDQGAATDGATTLSAPVPTAGASSAASRPTATAASAEALRELASNPRLDLSRQARQVLTSQPVDLRLATLLVQLSSLQRLSVAEVPVVAAAGSEPVRAVVLDGLADQPVGADPEALTLVQRQLAAQDPAYRAEAVQQQDGGTAVLIITLPPATS